MKMRVLICVSNDYVVTEVNSAQYSPTTCEVTLNTPTCSYVVKNVPAVQGKYAMRDLTKLGFYDFSEYPAK